MGFPAANLIANRAAVAACNQLPKLELMGPLVGPMFVLVYSSTW